MNQVEIFSWRESGSPSLPGQCVQNRIWDPVPTQEKFFVVGHTPYPHAFWKVCGSESQDSLVGSAGIFVAFRIVDSMSKAFTAFDLDILFMNAGTHGGCHGNILKV